MKFFHAQDCAAFITSHLADSTLNTQSVRYLVDQLTPEFELTDDDLLSEPAFDLIVGRWVIRDEQLDIFKCLRDAVVAMAPVNFFLNAPTTAAVTAVLAAVAGIARNALRFGTTLTPSQLVVVAMLRASGPLLPEEIAAKLNDSNYFPNALPDGWTSQEVATQLNSLKEALTRNGRVALVEVASDGRWNLRGL